jgi:hypothetical protein
MMADEEVVAAASQWRECFESIQAALKVLLIEKATGRHQVRGPTEIQEQNLTGYRSAVSCHCQQFAGLRELTEKGFSPPQAVPF